ncbi:bifunctional aldolase/short-chain dehydrogenase [Magnetospira sp. QH-2]|uniref:bifunctional aldolase/short-chain dehydrogenase n=1 Tax=Magnetospira sp. (strain QH-2) TaxID=1288970 RepID=UPI0003E81972|nr:bifunctional aldolase/short-chain dehydrogenase [Magnetospira sp. QH-2]CCQ75288.1 putative Short-chain dehydrogenase/reductase [Magnetospira sp. QH-2]
MHNLWSETESHAAIARYGADGINEDWALRTYTTRLLGSVPELVLHGGGNTSVKTSLPDLTGDTTEVLCVKGSGWDMGTIEPAGLPAVRLEPLLKLQDVDSLTDEEMVNLQRTSLMDASAPNPSVETLLHAFIPHKFIDHTHANAVVALTDQPDGEARARDLYGDRMAIVPYVMPGFYLARDGYRAYLDKPDAEGLILVKHGIFTFGATAREAYDRMIELVSVAEDVLAKAGPKVYPSASVASSVATVAQVAPILRGLVAEDQGDDHEPKRLLLDFRTSAAIRAFVDGADLSDYSQRGTVTPDHVIRTKPKPLVLPCPEAGKLDAFAKGAKAALAAYQADYQAYFERNNARLGGIKTPLDPMPRIALVPGLGLFGMDKSRGAAAIAADLAETNIDVITAAEGLGTYDPIPEADQFDLEYWSLEQAKLGKGSEKALARQVCLVTGGGSGIGAATARAFAAQGCEVVVLDRDEPTAQAMAEAVKGLGIGCDVTDKMAVTAAIAQVCETYGGLDIVVSNAGAAWQGRIGEVDEETLRQSFELNFWGHHTICQEAVRVMTAQSTGGCLLFNTSKQALNPGKNFGPYGLPKAATLFLMKQYALDHGRDGIRANAVNADRIRSGLLTDDFIAQRSVARGVSEHDYMAGNLLGREVTAEDVAQAFVDLAKSRKTTAAVMTVDGGNIEASVR